MRSNTVVVVNPSPDVYGADLQMLQTVTALIEVGRRVVVALPEDGELVPGSAPAVRRSSSLTFRCCAREMPRPGHC